MEIGKILLAWAAFGVFHSVTVSERYEEWVRRAMGERAFSAYHRLLFTAYSAAALVAVLLYIRFLPDAPLYRVPGWAHVLFHGMQAAGVALLLWTPWDVLEFTGVRQLMRHYRGAAPLEEKVRLFTKKAYGLVRHPLYLGFSLILAFRPAQTRSSLASTVAIVAYFCIGTFFEERRMERTFGEAYREYRRRVPRFLPLPRP